MNVRALVAIVVLALAGCGRSGAPDAPAPESDSASTLRMLAGSELKELEPALKQAAAHAGVDLRVSYAGTLESADRANAGENFDVLLPANGAYLSLALS